MRGFALLLALAVAVLVAGLTFALVAAIGRAARRRAVRAARWRPRHFGRDGTTVVTVSLVALDGRILDEYVVERIAAAEPDWTDRFLRAHQVAEERAFHLNSADTGRR
ncbi:hypothetical protein ACWT_4461 [Actinoplanes sp. SE50]|uniref:hypothetical protein n=1 Tax=unclassified Actinoplanes TaxID=2626549 RepID=UPI00023ECD10|nr:MULTISPECIES: hypothetical protein [unclassified Actinoplanes]AEV85483.1 hypothetical protein ACPL_4592 [Actinoplanes sp. SE50/110]ATO83876.1 hypothetical protein ACWT_4461 [Actinoplanes sp. SE50]SLM01286.1 hypothetical protein ACSP50_4522 [Actinoplanes sp. SE50/110]